MARFIIRLLLAVVLAALVAAGVVLGTAPDPTYRLQSWLAGSRYTRYDPLIADLSRKHGVDPLLVKAIAWRESAFQTDMVGTSGERGLMQVGEAAARDWAKALKVETFVPTDLFDPKTNVDAGSWYFKKALDRWKQKTDPIPFALAEYNAGHGRVERWIAETGRGEETTAADLLSAIDFPTTRKYIEDITARYHFYQKYPSP
ncbi:MAG TPA: transglycosylase SLT domain-containing protein [Chthoniobacter sp.]|nr:transglycosylase SLT domain-containing protein [Chthoniobacter sp.]